MVFWFIATSILITSLEAAGDIHLHLASGELAAEISDGHAPSAERDCSDCACLLGHLFGLEWRLERSQHTVQAWTETQYRFFASNHRAPPGTPPPIVLY